MARVVVSYLVPVQVVVDTDTSSVERVVVIDTVRNRGGFIGNADTGEPITDDPSLVERAYGIAESEEWPAHWDTET